MATPGVWFVRLLGGVFALAGPVVLVLGVRDLARGESTVGDLPPMPLWFLACAGLLVAVVLATGWRSSGMLRRTWEAGGNLRRAAVLVVTAAVVAFPVLMGLGALTPLVLVWLLGGLCATGLLIDKPSRA
ncbi:hypothetical protein [Streptomyces sp. NPDC060194]|uniref:hypothetical protein n=1 Tax=Streptomyces sp. NPDC060194 TaxID=3347069 RepID=UPI00364F9059